MKNKYLVSWVLILALAACSGSGQSAITPVSEPNEVAVISTVTEAAAPMPSDTPLPAATITATASITPTPTITPENSALAESGYDFANVKLSHPEPDRVVISFDYRIDKYNTEYKGIGLSLPSLCPDFRNTPYPETIFRVPKGPITGKGQVEYRIKSQGECNVPFFYLVIYSPFNNGRWPTPDQAVYQERIDQPIEIVRGLPPINSKTLTTKNFLYQITGSWSGRFTFDYAFSPEIPVADERYGFALEGAGGVYVCGFYTVGPVISGVEGSYMIDIDFNTKNSFWITDQSCISRYSSLTYDQLTLSVIDLGVSSHERIYQHAIDLAITLKGSP